MAPETSTGGGGGGGDATSGLCQEDASEPSAWDALRELSDSLIGHFGGQQDEGSARICAALNLLGDSLESIKPKYAHFYRIAPLFDYDERTPGNGYRSFLSLVDLAVAHNALVCRDIDANKLSVLFRKAQHVKEIEASSQLLASLCKCLEQVGCLFQWQEVMDDGQYNLFPSKGDSLELMRQAETINQYCYYGRCLGFQFCENMKTILKAILVGMASFSEIFYANGTLLGRCTNTFQYLVDPEARARRIVTISQHADISFCKAFWHLNESDFFLSLPQIVMPTLAINQLISIPPEELECETLSGTTIKIPVPNSHIGKKPIHVRLVSSKRRIGMVGSGSVKGQLAEQSEWLLFHCHGGGFSAQSSRSHECYLRTWTHELDVPILSVDYSLAPEAPYPRALEEVLYAYVWALKHANSLLGSTARKVVFVGDSAGANLNLVTAIRCLELNIRPPDGIFMAYAPVLLEFTMSPARFLCLSDPVLPIGFLMRCLKAYALTESKKESWEKSSSDDLPELDKSDTDRSETSFAEVSESDLIALALSPNGEEDQDEAKLDSLPSDSTLNSVSLTEADTVQGTENSLEETKSREYIKRFLDMYKNSKLGASVPIINSNARSPTSDGPHSDSKTWTFFGWSLNQDNNDRSQRFLASLENGGLISDEMNFTIPPDPHLSPIRTSDELLLRLPMVKILTLELDPCLDDCVMFARKLKSLQKPVTLDILSGLPHGFLNLSVVSKEAHEASLICAQKIRELFESS